MEHIRYNLTVNAYKRERGDFMMGKRKASKLLFFVLLLVFTCIMAACSNSNQTSGEKNKDDDTNQSENTNNGTTDSGDSEEGEPEPVTLLMMTHWGDEQFEQNFKQHIEKEFPHITLEHVSSNWRDIEENVFAKNLEPDIIMTSVTKHYLDMDLLADHTPLIEKHNFDLDSLDQSILTYLTDMSNEGELNGLPYIRPEYALVYNPDIFDLFGVEYPTDGMTWDEVIELAKKVTGERNGVAYRGLHPGSHMFTQVPDSLLVDPETDEPIVDQSEPFKIYLERLEEIYSIPGNEMLSADGSERGVDMMREGILAMDAGRAYTGAYVAKSLETGLNFDFVSHPIWGGEYGDYHPNEPGNGLAITTLSQHPDEAFQVVAYLLGDEHQAWQSAMGNLPAIVDQEVRDAYMKDNEHYDEVLKDKNLSAITNANPAPLPIKSEHDAEIMEGTNFREGLYNKIDVNTIIREMQEKAEGNAKNYINKN